MKFINLFNLFFSIKTNRGSGSGGFTENLFIAAAKEICGEDVNDVEYKILKNSDFQELSLCQDGEVKLSFAIANGFRNIQNLVQKMKRKRCHYDFVEVMACPSGCLNGGAQVNVFFKIPTLGKISIFKRAWHLLKLLPYSSCKVQS